MAMLVRQPYMYDVDQVSNETGLKCQDKSLAKQEFREEADINVIVKRFGLTGQLPPVVRTPQYGDFTGITDYHTAVTAVREAEEGFMELPAQIRDRFHNDPQALLEFLADKDNHAEAQKLGLVKATEPQAQPAAVTPPSTPPAPAQPS